MKNDDNFEKTLNTAIFKSINVITDKVSANRNQFEPEKLEYWAAKIKEYFYNGEIDIETKQNFLAFLNAIERNIKSP